MNRDYYIFSHGRLKRKDNTLYLIDSEDNKRSLPIEQVDKLHLFGEIDLNSKLLTFLPRFGVMLNFYNYYGYYAGTYYPREQNVSGFMKVKQAACYNNYKKRLELAKLFVESAVHHILRNLRRYDAVGEELIAGIEKERNQIGQAVEIAQLMGVEGRIRRRYYQGFNMILANGFAMQKRVKRPPNDPVNALISFGNSLMYTTVLGEIYKTQVDPTISFLHEPSTKRFSLSLDLAEIFKPLIIDTIIFKLINNRMIKEEDFDNSDGICFLSEQGKKKFIAEYDKKLKSTIKHRKLKRKVSYQMFIRLECYKLIKHFIEDQTYKPLKAWW
ncbi:MAG: type I-B CRISPR-associated endonuclease Cas1b [Bacillota bacterium]